MTENDNIREIELELQLGDVILIFNKENENLNEQSFIIDYIDNSKIILINVETMKSYKLKINEDGSLGDGNISKIEILSRAETPSYARQNGLIPNKWVNIYFDDGEFPVIITGEITNIEEDMIEIKTIEGDVIYINFEYKGIPENLPISNIEIREKPLQQEDTEKQQKYEQEQENEQEEQDLNYEIPNIEPEKEMIEASKLKLNVATKDIKDQLREILVKADQVVFGDEELGPIKQFVDVSSKSQRYSIWNN